MGNVVNLFNRQQSDLDQENMDVKAFRTDIIRPALKITELWSPSAENLLVGTALAESSLQVVKQIGGGPALSFFQIEPATYMDCVQYLNKKQTMRRSILTACYLETFPESTALIWNMRLATLIARVKYWRNPTPLPSPADVEAMAQYWKKVYNTGQGRGTIEHYIEQWSHYGCA